MISYANSVKNRPIFAERAQNDAAGNEIGRTYATKAELPTVDQTYDATSTNAQSGVAVAQAVASAGGDTPLPAVAAKTLRFEFEDPTYNPSTGLAVTGGTWTVVSASKGIWDFNYPQASWNDLFKNKIVSSAQACRVVDSNMTGVTSVSALVFGCSQLKGLCLKSTGDILTAIQLAQSCSHLSTASFGNTYGNGVNAAQMFTNCNVLKEFKCNHADVKEFRVNNGSGMFQGCSYLRTLDFDLKICGGGSIISSMFNNCQSLRSVYITGMSNNVDASNMFADCKQIQIAPILENLNISNASGMFKNCKSLLETPNICKCFHGCTNFSDAFNGCTSLRRINYIDTAVATNVSNMFKDCTNVEYGADTLYQQMSTQSTPPSSYSDCFTDCGSGTPSGTAALATIPASWGGAGS